MPGAGADRRERVSTVLTDRNSSRLEIVIPASRACARTRLASPAGSLTVNTVPGSGPPTSRGLVHIAVGLPDRAAQPAGQHAGRLTCTAASA